MWRTVIVRRETTALSLTSRRRIHAQYDLADGSLYIRVSGWYQLAMCERDVSAAAEVAVCDCCCCCVRHRSPWSNQYDPPLEDGTMPSDRLRRLEVDANAAFDQYRDMYFEGGVSSVYLWDLDHGFAGG